MTKFIYRAFLPAAFAVACASPSGQRSVIADPITTQLPTTPTSISAGTADVIITQFESATVVRAGQTVGLMPPRAGVRWQVTFSPAAVQLLTPGDRLAEPGDEGWVWKALAPGSTEITLTSVPPPCANPPCAPNVFRMTITLDITGSR